MKQIFVEVQRVSGSVASADFSALRFFHLCVTNRLPGIKIALAFSKVVSLLINKAKAKKKDLDLSVGVMKD